MSSGCSPRSLSVAGPVFTYADALLMRRDPELCGVTRPEGRKPSLAASARVIEAMAAVAGRRLGLSMGMAVLFGNQVADLATGVPAAAGDGFARSSLADLSGDAGWGQGHPLAEDCWLAAQPRLARIYRCLSGWSDDAAGLQRERRHWRRVRKADTPLPTASA